jgi:hypothetical protein
LQYENPALFVIYDDSIDLLVIGSICNGIPSRYWVKQKNAPQIPRYKSLAIIGEVLLVETIFADLPLNLFEHTALS